MQSRISKLHIGTFNRDMGACGSIVDLVNDRHLNSYLNVNWLYNKECSDIITNFFKNRRKENKFLKKKGEGYNE